jgi:hypothetical protein
LYNITYAGLLHGTDVEKSAKKAWHGERSLRGALESGPMSGVEQKKEFRLYHGARACTAFDE